jgi:hypothetical protein
MTHLMSTLTLRTSAKYLRKTNVSDRRRETLGEPFCFIILCIILVAGTSSSSFATTDDPAIAREDGAHSGEHDALADDSATLTTPNHGAPTKPAETEISDNEDQAATPLPPAQSEQHAAPEELNPAEFNTNKDEEIPLSLPPLSDQLFEPTLGPVSPESKDPVFLIAHGRLRFEADDSRDFSPEDDLQVGIAYTGRLGVDIPIGPYRARLVVGDGQRIGQDRGTLAGPWIDASATGLLYELGLRFHIPIMGAHAYLYLGRQPLTVGDGRWLGQASFDPRGRVYDGLLVEQERWDFRLRAGTFYLGNSSFDSQRATRLYIQAVSLVDLSFTNEYLHLDLYGLLHRDSLQNALGDPIAYWIGTTGLRSQISRWGFKGAFGLDLQTPVDEANISGVDAAGLHADMRLRYGPQLSVFAVNGMPYMELSVDWTGGIEKYGRTFRAPGPSYHPFLGRLDLVSSDNVASYALTFGLQLIDTVDIGTDLRLITLANPHGRLYDTYNRLLLDSDNTRTERTAFAEIDSYFRIDLPHDLYLISEAGIAFPGPILEREVPIMRFLVSLGFNTEIDIFSVSSPF